MSKRDDIRAALAGQSVTTAIVDLPGVGRVMVRELTLGDLDAVDFESTAKARAKNVALSLYTEDGKERVFDPDSDADLDVILALGTRTINKLTAALAEKNSPPSASS